MIEFTAAILPGHATEIAGAPEAPKRKRRKSAAARARIAEAQRKRWAELKRQSGAVTPRGSKEAETVRRWQEGYYRRYQEAMGREAGGSAVAVTQRQDKASAKKKAPEAVPSATQKSNYTP